MIHLHDTSRLLKALGDETRLRLLHLLGEEELKRGVIGLRDMDKGEQREVGQGQILDLLRST